MRRTEPRPRSGGVYFVQAGEGGPIKIGVASNVRERLQTLQTGSAVVLRLLGVAYDATAPEEAALHERFAAHRIRGEWFRPAADLLEHVAALPPRERRPRPPSYFETPAGLDLIAHTTATELCEAFRASLALGGRRGV